MQFPSKDLSIRITHGIQSGPLLEDPNIALFIRIWGTDLMTFTDVLLHGYVFLLSKQPFLVIHHEHISAMQKF